MIRPKHNLVKTGEFYTWAYIRRWVEKTSLIKAMQTFPVSFETGHFIHLSHMQTVRDLDLKRDELKNIDFKLAPVLRGST